MSFSIWVSAFEDEGSFWFPVAELHRRFSGHIKTERSGNWLLEFDEGPCLTRVIFQEGKTIDGFTIRRPPDYLAFWDIIGGILRDLPCVLYWASTPNRAVMGSLDLMRHLPASFVEIHGIPWVTTDGAKIRKYVEENS